MIQGMELTLERFPSLVSWQMLNRSLDGVIETTSEFSQARLANWLLTMRRMPLSRWPHCSSEGMFWLFPTPPHQWFLYGWMALGKWKQHEEMCTTLLRVVHRIGVVYGDSVDIAQIHQVLSEIGKPSTTIHMER